MTVKSTNSVRNLGQKTVRSAVQTFVNLIMLVYSQ